MNKKLLTIILVIIIVFFSIIIFIPSKENSDELTSLENENTNSITNENSPGESDEKYNIDDLENTKEIALKFAELIYSVDSKEPLKFPEQSVKYTTEVLKERIIAVANTEELEVYKRDVESVEAIESKYDDIEDSIMWNVEAYANVFDESGNLTNKEKGDINILFSKENGVYRVSEYSIERKIMWNVEAYANVFDESGNLTNKEKGDINILFSKENGVYRVSEYSIERKEKN